MTSTPTSVAIVGAGLAGAKTAEELRTAGFDGAITLLGREEHRPYERPPLSKTNLLKGTVPDADLFVHEASWYSEHDVDLRLGCTVDAVDLETRTLTARVGGSSQSLPFDALVLATGSSPRHLDVPGADLSGVHYLRTLDDSRALHAALATRPRVVLIGGGWIGLEVAAAGATLGASVTVLESSGMPLGTVLGERIASVLVEAHRAHGVDVRTDVDVAGFTDDGAGRVTGVELRDGTQVAADLVVVGVGATPNLGLALAMGLDLDNGVLTDEFLRTSHAGVLAVGDIVNAWHPLLERRIRVEHWANALNQPKAVAATIVGERTAYERLPYFYSDQYDLGLEYTGHVARGDVTDVVVRGEEASGAFMAFWTMQGRVVAGLSVNIWDEMPNIQELIRSGDVVPASRLSDPNVPLGELVGVH
ncbi:NAD(P)/FAD-dependent oxidoreductase [Knoellia sp. Soil729]|uniref:NAD(P)/FAD-dependent oxidoreductase n=1 Tax=Knoellia sp. Soil729 TaxID=1736394 RepID=UPI0006FB4E3F|nr:FAD-dependent oxidoreductase [Knoellia sp. Soil729]KRE41102.1 pyridine nucleotide-disulfide oxidoreductase [Knoellia sp. Soil729]